MACSQNHGDYECSPKVLSSVSIADVLQSRRQRCANDGREEIDAYIDAGMHGCMNERMDGCVTDHGLWSTDRDGDAALTADAQSIDTRY